jgi:hypothetical protein
MGLVFVLVLIVEDNFSEAWGKKGQFLLLTLMFCL